MCPQFSTQDTSPGPQGVHNSLYRILHQVPRVFTIDGFHYIQDTSPGPQGVHNRGAPLYTRHFTRSPKCPQHRGVPLYTGHFPRTPRCPQWRGSTVYKTLHQVPKVSTIDGSTDQQPPSAPQCRPQHPALDPPDCPSPHHWRRGSLPCGVAAPEVSGMTRHSPAWQTGCWGRETTASLDD